MALRMHRLGAKGVVVSGRVRDTEELQSLEGLQVRTCPRYCRQSLADQFRYGPALHQQLALPPRLWRTLYRFQYLLAKSKSGLAT